MRATAASGNALTDWVHIEAIRALVHHTSAVLVAVLLFGFTGLIVRRLLHEGPLKRLIVVIDEVVLLLLLVFFAYELLMTLHK
jgi:nitrate reductase gamma subunit